MPDGPLKLNSCMHRDDWDRVDLGVVLEAADLGTTLGYFEDRHRYVRPTSTCFRDACVDVVVIKGCAKLGAEACTYPFSPSVYHLTVHVGNGIGGNAGLPTLAVAEESITDGFADNMTIDDILLHVGAQRDRAEDLLSVGPTLAVTTVGDVDLWFVIFDTSRTRASSSLCWLAMHSMMLCYI